MKVKIDAGRVIRLTPKVNSSLRRGGVYDLDALGVDKDTQKAIAALKGVTVVTDGAAAPKPKGGDS